MSTKHQVEIGSGDTVSIDKLFGPTIFSPIRITADLNRQCWVIERMWINTGTYIEWCTIPNQFEEEFQDFNPNKES